MRRSWLYFATRSERDGAPHGLNVTEQDRLTQDLLTFLGR